MQFRYVKDIYTGDKRMELNVVPAFSVRMTPPLAVFRRSESRQREIHVTVTNGTKGAAKVSVTLATAGRDGPPRRPACRSTSSMKTNRYRRASR